MSGVSATRVGVPIQWPSKLTEPTNNSQKPHFLSPIPHHLSHGRQKLIIPACKIKNHICRAHCSSSANILHRDPSDEIAKISHSRLLERNLVLADLDPATAKLAIAFLGPFLSAFGFLFILRIIMSWYPKLPVDEFPYVIAYAPTEPLLVQTRKLIPPLAGVDVTPVVWFGLLSFLNEILVGPQGLLVLLSQQQV